MTRVYLFFLGFVLFVGLMVDMVRFYWSIIFNPTKAWTIALAQDEADNVALNGRLGQSISLRAALACQANRRWGCFLCKILSQFQKDHCQKVLADNK